MELRKASLKIGLLGVAVTAAACHPTAGPDKTLTGAVLGAGWGAGAGAVIGNQVNDTGPGAAIGSGLGAAAGIMTGIGLDIAEGTELEQQRELDALKVQVSANERKLILIQNSFDSQGRALAAVPSGVTVFFDPRRASLRGGSAAELERIAEGIKMTASVRQIQLHGHSDDSGSSEENQRLSEARARTVQTFLAEHGISLDRMKIFGHGSSLPVATNESEPGRQLNRRVEIVLLK